MAKMLIGRGCIDEGHPATQNMNNPKQIAIQKAKKCKYHFMHGAAIVQRDKIVGTGYNKVHHTGIRNEGIHAERDAIQNTTARHREGSILYVCRLNRKGQLKMSRPCSKCMKLIKKVGIGTICYSTNQGEWVKEVLRS